MRWMSRSAPCCARIRRSEVIPELMPHLLLYTNPNRAKMAPVRNRESVNLTLFLRTS